MANNLIESNKATAEAGKGPVLVVTTQHRKKDDPIMRYLSDGIADTAIEKIFKSYQDIKKEYEVTDNVSESKENTELLHLTDALAKKWEGRKIVMLLDEIGSGAFMNFSDIDIHQSVRMILVMNPVMNPVISTPLILPSSFLQVTLTTPYRSTIAITSLAQFIAKNEGLFVPEGDFGSDVEGTKPIFIDVGNDKGRMKEALAFSRHQLGDGATILYSGKLPDSLKTMVGKSEDWECYRAGDFQGSEAAKVVAVTSGYSIYELITRAQTKLVFILVCHENYYDLYAKTKGYFQQASAQGLVEMK